MSMFDKNIGKEARASLEFAEDSRETEWVHPSFAAMLYQGQVKWDLMHPFPRQSDEDKRIGDEFLEKLRAISTQTTMLMKLIRKVRFLTTC